MFYVEIRDESGDVTNGYTVDGTLEKALGFVKDEVENGAGLESVKLYKEVELSITIDIQVKG